MLAGRQVQVPRPSQYSCSALPTRTCEGGASTSGRQHVVHSRRSQQGHTPPRRCAVAAPDREQVQSAEEPLLVNTAPASPILCDPDTFTLNAGELGTLAQPSTTHPADVFRCAGCKLEECQVCSCAIQRN